jgi:hypothetical protein
MEKHIAAKINIPPQISGLLINRTIMTVPTTAAGTFTLLLNEILSISIIDH